VVSQYALCIKISDNVLSIADGDRIKHSIAFAAVHESGPGTFETSVDVRSTAAFGGNPDIEQTSPELRSLTDGVEKVSKTKLWN
jgi:hypothetical protein